ncbi:MAG: CDP-alcohol phosphatidyltransferase family protein [Chloracidobacterium sp.]|uniref:CDP-diacylglycerol--glycerol-3-phosphate 3-phosphatidyltransferase n=1 Tax=Chloracidobacterium validum TaxID=2821543 RepID=A0ABX8B8E9_9BACT|nr:CDP-alcohol phosphatidyltransferase family protein [Chloracidobacterium validum]QUW02941.1 CDP-alcohol phosphatidyltransferase family protein [Chloracidobacterium validum]
MKSRAPSDDHYRDILTVPNVITLFRILLVPVFVVCFLRGWFWWATAAFALAGLSDAVDGWLARRLNAQSRLGQALDPIADKLLMLSSYIVMAIPSEANVPIPWWLSSVVIGRDIGIVTAAAIIAHVTGFQDFKPSLAGKISTFCQVALIVLYLIAQVWAAIRPLLPTWVAVVFVMTLYSGLHYIWFVVGEVQAFRRQAGGRPS